MKVEEPLVCGEQGVVYLFTRYWKKIPELKNQIKEIYKMQTRFPDCLFINNNGNLNGIEFEFNLSGFKAHIEKRYKFGTNKKITGLKNFINKVRPKGYFLIIYWNEDIDINIIKNKLKKYNRDLRFKFVNLSKFFIPIIKRKDDINYPLIFFTKKSKLTKMNFKKIEKDFKSISKKGLINNEKDTNEKKNIRIIGYDPKRANDIQLSHWNLISFFTTTSKLWYKDTIFKIIILRDKENNLLIIEPNYLFKFTTDDSEIITSFFNRHYFIGRLNYWENFSEPYCVIYSYSKFIPSKYGETFIDYIIEIKSSENEDENFRRGGYSIYSDEEYYLQIIKKINRLKKLRD